ncbi:hypothetical protein NECAME_12385 [Necator americanus]|uniref:Uncharacterized protein n=1 Tax=Necator americanus TaxID=51031 RepID=W2T3A4_NECAM|nr:hypothetical protein NECAME_12385 [Necator americanus]ETN75457.1 hypothetical protein NECAME_12385 [Necator americanus]
MRVYGNVLAFDYAQDALRRFHHYGLNNIYGIKSLNRRHIASFPIIHAVDTLDTNGTLVAEDSQSTVFTVDPDIPDGMLEEFPNTKHTYIGSVKVPKKSQSFLSRGKNSGKHVDVTDRLANFGAHNGMSVQLIEIRKVKRVGGGYPYGPKNFSVTEFMPPLRAEKPTEGIEEIVFKTHYYHKKNQSISSDAEDIWAVQRFNPPSALCNSTLSCRYCLTYWKIQKKFKPFNRLLTLET